MYASPFAIQVPDHVLADLRSRIHNTRWPEPALEGGWEQGTDHAYLRSLLAYWAGEFDWRARERELNTYEQLQIEVDGLHIHVVRELAHGGDGVPLLLMNGWPSSFVELLPLVPLLTNPEAHGLEGPAFDVILPSLPGFGFSTRPEHPITMEDTAELWHRLMELLGYERYGVHGSDFGAGVATFMGLQQPSAVLGVHLSSLELQPALGPRARPLSDAERTYLDRVRRWDEGERGYSAIQSTRPQTLGYGLNDSPVGLAAWIMEKWRSWSDSDGDPDAHFSRDFLLTNLTIYWVTQSAASSARYYFDNRWFGRSLTSDDFVSVATALAVFSEHLVPEGTPPREWVERLYHVTRWTPMPRGGHFAAAEEPELLAQDLIEFFGHA